MIQFTLSNYNVKCAASSWKLIQKRFNTTNVSNSLQITNTALALPVTKQQLQTKTRTLGKSQGRVVILGNIIEKTTKNT
ncbi:hypothetical protein PS6_005691 [Mucor atramentarius]